MVKKPTRFSQLGRPLCFIILAMMLLPVLLSATAPKVAASPDKNWETPSAVSASSGGEVLIDGFEAAFPGTWTYDELDTNAGIAGERSNLWKTEGGYCYRFKATAGAPDVGDWAKIYKSIDLTSVIKLRFDAYHWGATGENFTAELIIDEVIKWTKNKVGIGNDEYLNQEIDVSDLTGFQTVEFKVTYHSTVVQNGPGFDKLYAVHNQFPPENTIDDNTTTKWRPSPANESGAWVNWDLGNVKGVSGCKIYWGADENYRPTAYHIQTSEDNSEWTTVVTETEAASASAWKEYSWTEALARYVKLTVDTHGASGTDIYEMDAEVNYTPTIENIAVTNSLVDRKLDYSGSEAVLTTTITIRVKDNDGYGEIQPVHLWIRDNNDSVALDNLQITDNTVVDENTLDFTYTYNPADNLPDDNLGAFDAQVVTEDIWGASENNDWGGDGAALFTVDDLTSTINFDPASPFVGYNLTVSGTHSRVVGAVSIDASWLIDNKHGQFALGDSNTYDKTYMISNATADENVSVTLRTRDAPLDGSSVSSYKTNENVKFEVWVRYEENYEVVGWIPDENRPVELLFEWDGGTYPYTLTENPENISLPAGETSAKIVKITDNDAYWRYIISELPGGILTFVIVDDPTTVEQYRFFLQDYTGLYTPPNGQLLIKSWIGTNLAGINDDFWGADWRTTAWLVTGVQYQIWVRGADAPLRLVGPIDAVVPSEEKTIIVQVVISELDPIFDHVYWAAWRESDAIIRVEYQDNLDNTIEAHVGIYDTDGNLMSQYQPDNEWFIVTWPYAENTESYEVVLTVQHGIYGDFTRNMSIGFMEGPPGVPGGISDPFGLPAGVTLAAIGSVILIVGIVGLSFDALRVQLGVLAMALTTLFCWYMGFLPLPGPYDGAFTATLILVAAALFALTWRRGK